VTSKIEKSYEAPAVSLLVVVVCFTNTTYIAVVTLDLLVIYVSSTQKAEAKRVLRWRRYYIVSLSSTDKFLFCFDFSFF
jgi:hypothetical protein